MRIRKRFGLFGQVRTGVARRKKKKTIYAYGNVITGKSIARCACLSFLPL